MNPDELCTYGSSQRRVTAPEYLLGRDPSFDGDRLRHPIERYGADGSVDLRLEFHRHEGSGAEPSWRGFTQDLAQPRFNVLQ